MPGPDSVDRSERTTEFAVAPARAPRRRRRERIPPLVLMVLLGLLSAAGLAAVLGTLLPDLPYLGFATTIVPSWAPRVLVLAVVAALIAGLLRWRGHRGRLLAVLITLSLLAAAGAAVIVGRMTLAAERAGVDVNLPRALGFGPGVVPVPELKFTYTTYEGQPLGLTVYPAARARDGSPAPVLVYLHGVGWNKGSREDRRNDMRWFADRGWMGVSVDYALSSDQRHLWDVTESQIGCALVWLAGRAPDLGGDPGRLALTGDSTGGNLAVEVGYRAADGSLASSCGGRIPAVAAVSTLYPAVDPTEMYGNADPFLGDDARGLLTAYVGGSPRQFPDRYQRITPATRLSKRSPPTLIIVGEQDRLVPPRGTYRFAERAREAGVETSLVRIPYADHRFDRTVAGSIGQQAYLQLTVNWLRAHGLGPG